MLGYRPDELPDLNQTLARPAPPGRPRGGPGRPHGTSRTAKTDAPTVHTPPPPPQGRHVPLDAVQRHRFFRAATAGCCARSASRLTSTRSRPPNRRWRTRRSSLRVTLDSISDSVITTDAQGQVARTSTRRRKSLCGLDTATRPTGCRWRSFTAAPGRRLRRQADNPVRAVLATGLRAARRSTPRYLNGTAGRPERVVADNAAPILDPAGTASTGAVLVFHDITDRHRAAEELQKAGRIESLGVYWPGASRTISTTCSPPCWATCPWRVRAGNCPRRAVDALSRAEKGLLACARPDGSTPHLCPGRRPRAQDGRR